MQFAMKTRLGSPLALLGIALAVVMPAPSFASAVGTFTQVITPGQQCYQTGTPSPVSCSANYYANTNTTYEGASGAASAYAFIGRLGSYASIATWAQDRTFDGQVIGHSYAVSDFADSITVVGSTYGLKGSLAFPVLLHGTITTVTSGSYANRAAVGAAASFWGGGGQNQYIYLTQSGYTNGVFVSVPFALTTPHGNGQYSATIDFGMTLTASETCIAEGYFAQPGSCSAVTDLSHTLQVTGLDAVDSNGHKIPNLTFISDSGYNYSSVPEPSSLLLLGTAGLGGLSREVYRRLRRRG